MRRHEFHQRLNGGGGGIQKHGSDDGETDSEEEHEGHLEEDDPLDAAQSPRRPESNGAHERRRGRKASLATSPSPEFQTDPVSGKAYRDHYMVSDGS